jgi:hypothetical protein
MGLDTAQSRRIELDGQAGESRTTALLLTTPLPLERPAQKKVHGRKETAAD